MLKVRIRKELFRELEGVKTEGDETGGDETEGRDTGSNAVFKFRLIVLSLRFLLVNDF